MHEVHNPFKINTMDEKTKLYVFSKREVALIFLFMFLIALTSFVFGVKIGKSYSFQQAGLSPQDRQTVDLLSGEEEAVNDVVEESRKEAKESQKEMPEMKGPDLEDLNKKLERHIKTETDGPGKPAASRPQVEQPREKATEVVNQMVEPAPAVEIPNEAETQPTSLKDSFSGKYTVQLGSHRSLNEAEAFAEGFRVRGYDPIITEKEIPNRGIWYRVSLGAFDTITQAKDYVKKEDSLFQGQEYVFVRFE